MVYKKASRPGGVDINDTVVNYHKLCFWKQINLALQPAYLVLTAKPPTNLIYFHKDTKHAASHCAHSLNPVGCAENLALHLMQCVDLEGVPKHALSCEVNVRQGRRWYPDSPWQQPPKPVLAVKRFDWWINGLLCKPPYINCKAWPDNWPQGCYFSAWY